MGCKSSKAIPAARAETRAEPEEKQDVSQMEVVQPEVQAVAVQADEGLVGAKTEPEETQCEELKEAETEIVTETKETQECEATDAPETTDAPVEVPQPKLPAEDEETVTTLPKDDDSPVMEDKVEGPKEVPLCSLCGWSIRDISK